MDERLDYCIMHESSAPNFEKKVGEILLLACPSIRLLVRSLVRSLRSFVRYVRSFVTLSCA